MKVFVDATAARSAYVDASAVGFTYTYSAARAAFVIVMVCVSAALPVDSRTSTANVGARTTATFTLTGTNVTWTASGGTIGLTFTGGPITLAGTLTLGGTLAIANGGSGQTTAQDALNAFAGAVTSGYYLRGNGTNVLMSGIQAADVPTLNQNTTGSAATFTSTTQNSRFNSIGINVAAPGVAGAAVAAGLFTDR